MEVYKSNYPMGLRILVLKVLKSINMSFFMGKYQGEENLVRVISL